MKLKYESKLWAKDDEKGITLTRWLHYLHYFVHIGICDSSVIPLCCDEDFSTLFRKVCCLVFSVDRSHPVSCECLRGWDLSSWAGMRRGKLMHSFNSRGYQGSGWPDWWYKHHVCHLLPLSAEGRHSPKRWPNLGWIYLCEKAEGLVAIIWIDVVERWTSLCLEDPTCDRGSQNCWV